MSPMQEKAQALDWAQSGFVCFPLTDNIFS